MISAMSKIPRILLGSALAIGLFLAISAMSPIRDNGIHPGLLTPNLATLTAGQTTTVTVTMDGYATSPTVVSLTSSNTNAINVPSSVTVETGSNEATFTATAVTVLPRAGTRTSTVTATANGSSASTTMTVQ